MKLDPAKAKLVAEYAQPAPLSCCAFDPDGKFLFAGGRAANVYAVDTSTGRSKVLPGHEGWLTAMVPAGQDVVLTADSTGRVIAWMCRGDEPKPLWSQGVHPSGILGLSVSPDAATFATSDDNGTVRISRLGDGKKLNELPRITSPVYAVAFLPDGQRLVTADHLPKKPRIQIWELATGKELSAMEAPDLSGYRSVEDIEWTGIRSLAVSLDGRTIAAAGRNGYDGVACVLTFDASTAKLQKKILSDSKGALCHSVRFHPDGFLVAACGDIAKGEIRCWNPATGVSLAQTATPSPSVGLTLHPTHKRFAVAQLVAKKGQNPDSGSVVVYEWSS